LERVLRIIRTLEQSRYGLTLNEMAREFDVSRRTLYRDLAAMERAGLGFEKVGGKSGASRATGLRPLMGSRSNRAKSSRSISR
jgi:predicted DNA-binding transcriptional regulator YafY